MGNPLGLATQMALNVETDMTEGIELTFHGAAQTVTGSCMEVAAKNGRLLVDCGLFQGPRSLEALNYRPFAFSPTAMKGVILTHAHIDHSGLLPRLAAEGFAGPIYCTEATKDLLAYMLPDAARIQEWDAERRNQRHDRQDEDPIAPLYTSEDAEKALSLLHPVKLDTWFEPLPDLKTRLWNAGHILGAASVEMRQYDTSLLFSGDLGPSYKTFQSGPQAPQAIDHVVCESTYGDRERVDLDPEARRRRFASELREALAHNGNLIIPVFAVERTQELLFDIAMLLKERALPNRPVFIDSPLASRATSVFAAHRDELFGTGTGPIFENAAFHYVETAAESMRLHDMSGAIILAASGMCEGGRIRHHLIHNLARSDSTILFVGYQALGTLGRIILDGAHRVRISGHDVAVRARIRRIDSYSAHADRSGLIAWIGERRPIAGSLFIDHGEELAVAALKQSAEHLVENVIAPSLGDTYLLQHRVAAKLIGTRETPPLASDWQNDYADFSVNLKRRLRQIAREETRREAIADMNALLERYRERRQPTGKRRASNS